MTILGIYINKNFLANFALVLFGFTSLVQLLDLLNNTEDILQNHSGTWSIFYYIILRLPEIMGSILSFSILIAALITLGKFVQHNEILALKAFGMSFYKFLLTLWPSIVFLGVFHFVLHNYIINNAIQARTQWDAESALNNPDQTKGTKDKNLWLHDENFLIRLEGVLDQGHTLVKPIISKRNNLGNIETLTLARSARWEEAYWVLEDVQEWTIDTTFNSHFKKIPRLIWHSNLSPQHFVDYTTPAESLSFSDLINFSFNSDIGNQHPYYYYRTSLYRRLFLPFVCLIMVVLAAPIAQRIQRHGGILTGLATGIGLGFTYFIIDGIFFTLGEVGALPALFAITLPLILYLILGISLLIRVEGW
ncbi:MAG: LPS export ABC transporter permease LptG [Alphaproteobacteria bacterium]|nr:LPS export ABC transporter permease LptG [Alphaproteobacteria bacterium]